MRVVIVSIFKNERPYILEWLAHYKSLGFNDFIIGDNCSDDGTTELLEALDSAGVITRVHQPIHKYCSPKGPQLDFYERALSEYSDKYDVFGFLDADEFLYGEEGVSPLCELERLFSDPAVSAVGVNWRVFGVTEVEDETKLVTKRIVKSSSLDSPANKCIKSFVRPSKVMKMNCHRAELIDGKYVDASGELIDFEDGQGFGEMMQYVPNTKLRVAHYIVKSKTEFYEKKQKRGRAGVGASREDNLRTDAYFGNHSQYSEECLDLACRNSEIVKNIRNLKSDLMLNSNYYSQYSIVVTKILSDRIFGWVECLGQDLVDIVTVKATVSGLYECYGRASRSIKISDQGKRYIYQFIMPTPVDCREISDLRISLVGVENVSVKNILD